MATGHTCGKAFNAAAIALAILFTTATLTSMIPTSGNAFAYSSNQAKSDINECGNGFVPTNIGCQNTDSQIQGDENSVALTSQQTFPSVTREPPTTEPPPDTGTLILSKIVECAPGKECTGLPDPREFTFKVRIIDQFGEDIEDSISVQGSSEGKRVPIPPGHYQVNEESFPPVPDGLNFVRDTRTEGCSTAPQPRTEPISAGEVRECIITNTYEPEPPPTLTVLKNVKCVPAGHCPNLPDPSAFTMSVFELSRFSNRDNCYFKTRELLYW